MGKCKYCGESAGLLKSEHEACEEKFQAGKEKIIEKVQTAVFKEKELQALKTRIEFIAGNSYINDEVMKPCIIKGWETAVEKELSKGLLTGEREELLDAFMEVFEISHDELDQNGWLTKAVQSRVIENLRNGIIEKKFQYPGLQIEDLDKGEEIIWAFLDVNFYIVLTNNTFVMNGKGYKPKNTPDDLEDNIDQPKSSIKSKKSYKVSTGIFVITNKRAVFNGENAGVPMKWDEISSISMYEDGVEIQRGAMVNSPMLFETGNGWFTYELIKGLRDLAFSAGDS